MLNVLGCASALGVDEIDPMLYGITHAIVMAVKIVIPVILIFLGMVDMGKAVVSNDEKEMKNSQTRLIKRIIYAVVIFLLVSLVQLIFGLVGNQGEGESKDGISSCISCFINGTEGNC